MPPPILRYPDPRLRQQCAEVTDFDASLAALVDDLAASLLAAKGIGLAAPQIGASLRVAVIGPVQPGSGTVAERGRVPGCAEAPLADRVLVLVNPEILAAGGLQLATEGCLSFPGVFVEVARPTWMRVRASRANGTVRDLVLEGLAAQAVMHEVEHLDGILLIDRVIERQRASASRR
jgi:peptide deformylase